MLVITGGWFYLTIYSGETLTTTNPIDTGKHSRLENLDRTLLGRVYQNQINLDAKANSNFISGTLESKYGGEMDDTRTINKRSELRARSFFENGDCELPSP